MPVYWALDDWPHFEPAPSGGRDGLSAPSKVLEIWTEELRYACDHAPGGLLTVTMHPECIGRGHRMAMLERFIDAARRSTASCSTASTGTWSGRACSRRLTSLSRPRARRPGQDVPEHRLGQLARERVLLARVVRADEDVPPDPRLRPVPEPRPRPRDASSPARAATVRNAASQPIRAERHEHPHAGEERQLPGEVRRAAIPLVGSGLFAGGAQRTAAAM